MYLSFFIFYSLCSEFISDISDALRVHEAEAEGLPHDEITAEKGTKAEYPTMTMVTFRGVAIEIISNLLLEIVSLGFDLFR